MRIEKVNGKFLIDGKGMPHRIYEVFLNGENVTHRCVGACDADGFVDLIVLRLPWEGHGPLNWLIKRGKPVIERHHGTVVIQKCVVAAA